MVSTSDAATSSGVLSPARYSILARAPLTLGISVRATISGRTPWNTRPDTKSVGICVKMRNVDVYPKCEESVRIGADFSHFGTWR